MLEVFGEVDGRHAANTEFVLDGVAVSKGGFETVEELRHLGGGSVGDGTMIRLMYFRRLECVWGLVLRFSPDALVGR